MPKKIEPKIKQRKRKWIESGYADHFDNENSEYEELSETDLSLSHLRTNDELSDVIKAWEKGPRGD